MKQRLPEQEAEVLRGVPRGRDRLQAGDGLAIRNRGRLDAERLDAVAVVAMRVGEQHRSDPAAPLRRLADRLDVSRVVGARVDHDGGVAANHVGVGAVQRHRTRIGSGEPLDVDSHGHARF